MDLRDFIIAAGYLGLWLVIFAESGVLVGIFFPGDSLLFTAGLLAAQGYFDIGWLVILCFSAAVLGDSVGYTFGKRVGRNFFTRPDSFFFKQERLEQAKAFYQTHGGKTIILARFIPGVRTLAPILAGIGGMHYRTFIVYNLVGGFFWAIGVTILGYYLGTILPQADKYLLLIILAIIVFSVLPVLWQLLGDSKSRQVFKRWFKQKILNRKVE
ncbi:VTT domain-containing protein [Patescibacteria group bacterium]|nr:VTT domain-containing protein [Patescibacteria group bacterium]